MNNLNNRYILIFLLLICGYGGSAQNAITWTDLVGVEVQPDNTLLKTGGWGVDNGGAASAEVLAAGANGWAEFTVYPTDHERYFGLTENNADATRIIDYAIKISGSNTIVIQEKGTSRGGFGGIDPGDVLRVERIGTTIEYKRNDSTLHISQVPSTTSLRVDVCLYHNNGEIKNGILNFGTSSIEVPNAPTSLEITTVESNSVSIQWADNSDDETGFIVERQTGSGAYEQIADLGANTTSYTDATVTGSVSYTYRIYAYNFGGNSLYSNTLTVAPEGVSREGFPVTWANLVGVEVQADNSLIKTAGWGTDNGGATSEEILQAGVDGWAGFTAFATDHERYFGLTENNTDATKNIDYAFKISSTNGVVISEKGGNVLGIGHIKNGDILRIERIGSTVSYIKNDTTYHISDIPSTGSLMVDVSIYHSTAEIKGAVTSFVAVPPPVGMEAMATDFDQNLISWKSPHDQGISFEIERSLSSTGNFVKIATIAGGAGQYKDANLVDGTTYYYRVRATNGEEYSGYSAIVSSTTKIPVAADINQSHKPMYNGNISAIKWKTHGDTEEKLYTYGYDPMNRITKAQYAQGSTATNTWTSAKGGYSVNNINYDLNGNIQSLNRQSMKEGLRTIDALTYSYNGRGNQLTAVSDAAGWDGFADRNISGDDYEYDANGNMTKDRNKEVELIEYNYLNLPSKVIKADGQYIRYIYDAAGTKLAQEVYDAEDNLVKRTDYMGEFIYENGELQLIQHQEGRIVEDETTGKFDYQYHLKDHLGNTRLTFTTKPKTISFSLNYENDEYNKDDISMFKEVAISSIADFNHTAGAYGGPLGRRAYTHSQILHSSPYSQVGSVIAIPVAAGDKLTAHVFAKYMENTANPNVGVNTLASALIGAFTGGVSGAGETGVATINNNFGSEGLIGGVDFPYEDADAPKAFLNVMFLPEEEVIDLVKGASFAYDQIDMGSIENVIDGNSKDRFDELKVEDFEASQNGYVLIYLSNEGSLTDVYFDDLEIELNESPIVQKDDYYPFGLQFNSYQRVTAKENRFLFNQGTGDKTFNTERITDLGLSMDMTKYRTYDYTTGRFMQVDPLADEAGQEVLTTYQYGLNNPIRYSDPYGDCVGGLPCPQWAQNAIDGWSRIGNMVSDGGKIRAHEQRNAPEPSVQRITGNKVIDAGLKITGGDVVYNAANGDQRSQEQLILSWPLLVSPGGRGPADDVAKSQIRRNAAQGAAFEAKVLKKSGDTQYDLVEQITIKSNDSGTKTRIDIMGTDKNTGEIVLTEAKSSATAPLTENQKKAYPEIQQSGGVVVGKGKEPYTGGTEIKPTKVNIVRPEHFDQK